MAEPHGKAPLFDKAAWQAALDGVLAKAVTRIAAGALVVAIPLFGYMGDKLLGTLNRLDERINAHDIMLRDLTATDRLHDYRLDRVDPARRSAADHAQPPPG